MTKINMYGILILFAIFIAASGCHSNSATAPGTTEVVKTPVTVTHIKRDTITEYLEVPATSAYLLKHFVKANANGYLHSATRKLGEFIKKGEVLFTIKTKESENLGNSITLLDSTFKFTGINNIRASDDGFISQLDHQTGDYVQDGEQLAVITDRSSFAFVMNVPYELRTEVGNKKNVEIILPDGVKLNGTIGREMPLMDSATQTQRILVHINSANKIPENIIARTRILKTFKNNGISIPKQAILTDETQTNFWIMKITDSTTAVKVPIQKGIETVNYVEVLSPPLTDSDLVVVTGNYGLPDTAKVVITNIEGK